MKLINRGLSKAERSEKIRKLIWHLRACAHDFNPKPAQITPALFCYRPFALFCENNMVALFAFLILRDSPNAYSVFINCFSGNIPASAIQKDVLSYDRSVIGMILMIPRATSSDAGTYRCTVRNQLGSDSRSFQVTLS